MSGWLQATGQWLSAAGYGLALLALVLVNGAGVALTALQLPGTWLILAATAGVAWWRWEEQVIGPGVLIALGVLAVLGEVLEFVAGGVGARQAGGSRRGAIAALVGGMVGAVAGSLLLPIPVLGTVLGAGLGAAGATVLVERRIGREWSQARTIAKGAFLGKLWGTAAKLGVAVVMWLVAAVAVVWP